MTMMRSFFAPHPSAAIPSKYLIRRRRRSDKCFWPCATGTPRRDQARPAQLWFDPLAFVDPLISASERHFSGHHVVHLQLPEKRRHRLAVLPSRCSDSAPCPSLHPFLIALVLSPEKPTLVITFSGRPCCADTHGPVERLLPDFTEACELSGRSWREGHQLRVKQLSWTRVST